MARKCSVFFKFLVPGFNKRLSLPAAFCSSVSEMKLDKAVIKSCLGSWRVRLDRSIDGVLTFEDGWEVFVNHHGLKLGEMVVFEHKGNMVFNAVAYESLGSEKEYELHRYKHQHDSKGKRTVKATASSTSRTLFRTTMRNSHGNHRQAYLTIPAKFARSNGIVATSRIILKDPSGRSWPLILSRWESRTRGSHRIATRKEGWYKFHEANKLKNGDVCTFKLKPVSSKSGSKSTCVIEVQITRGGS